jgi:hypothetical protein
VKRKYHLVKWQVCKSKKKCGLGIKNLWKMNIALLCKWWWALETGNGLWQEIVKVKYVKGSPICLIPNRINDSPIWKDLMKVRQIYLRGRGIKINNGEAVSLWLDTWLEELPLCQRYSVLYELVVNQSCSVKEVKEKGWVVQFKVRVQGLIREQWYELAMKLNNVNLNNERDEVYWKWTPSKKFTIKSMYEHLTRDDCGPKIKII